MFLLSKTLRWIESFLIGRSQTVVLNGNNSDELPVSSGVPQGSVLGPILFLLYINDLPDSLQSQVRLFADDTAVYLTVEGQADSKKLQEDLNVLQDWEKEWDMEFNHQSVRLCTSPGPNDLSKLFTLCMARSLKL